MKSTDEHADVQISLGEDYAEIRDSVRKICAGFPGAYWRDLEAREAYPSDFVRALIDAGHLAALIPEQYGGAGLPLRAAAIVLEEIHASGCNASACHAQMYIMGTLLRHGSAAQKLSTCLASPAASCGCKPLASPSPPPAPIPPSARRAPSLLKR